MQRFCYHGVCVMILAGACVERSDVLIPGPITDAVAEPRAAPFVDQISANNGHTCARSGDVLYCWGDNALGQLGVGSVEDRLTPTRLEQVGWQSVQTGLTHTCALSQQGEVYCWGNNERGQLGQGDTTLSRLPVRVELDRGAVALSSGFNHTCALLENGELWCWGDNNEGQLGQSDRSPGPESRVADALFPVLIPAPALTAGSPGQWKVVDAGEGHTCALQVDESLWCWGRNSQGQVGTPTREGQQRSPVLVSSDQEWARVDAGLNYTCALDREGFSWCWGHNQGTNSGSGNPFGMEAVDVYVPTRVGTGPWVDISTHTFHTCGLDAAAELWCWGRTAEGQIPGPGQDVRVSPLRVASNVAIVSAGMFSTCFAALDGSLQCSGNNDRWQLGAAGREEGIFLPVTLPLPAGGAGL